MSEMINPNNPKHREILIQMQSLGLQVLAKMSFQQAYFEIDKAEDCYEISFEDADFLRDYMLRVSKREVNERTYFRSKFVD